MGIFRQFPYSNFHEMNMDWIISNIKELIASNEDLMNDFDALKNYVEEYFINLNVPEVLQEVIQELIESGQLDQMVLDAINDLKEQTEELQKEVRSDSQSLLNYHVSYIKTLENFDIRPVICGWNKARNKITYLSIESDNSYVSIGDLADDYITPQPVGSILLTHPNDLTYYDPLNAMLVADGTPEIKVLNANTLTLENTITVDWGTTDVIGISYDSDTEELCVIGSIPNESRNVAVATINIDGSIIDTFTLPLINFHGHSVQDAYFQGCFHFNHQLNIIASSINGNGTPYGYALVNIDLINKTIRESRYYNIEGEAETAVVLNDEIIIFGHSSIAKNRYGAQAVFMSLVPRATISADIYVDESRALNGNGTQAEPFNSLSTAIYNVQNLNISAAILLASDVTHELFVSPIRSPKNITISGGGHTLYIVNDLTVVAGRWTFNNVTIARTSGAHYWTFTRFCTVGFESISFIRDSGAMPLIMIYNSICIAQNINVTQSLTDAFGIFQVRYGSILSIYVNNISMPTTNRIVNAIEGVIINTKKIPSTYTDPFAVGASSILIDHP